MSFASRSSLQGVIYGDSPNEAGPTLPVSKVVTDCFARVICDEAQWLRKPASNVSQSVLQIQARHLHFLTATLLLNRVTDMVGYLSLMWNPSWGIRHDARGDAFMYEDDFDPADFEPVDRSYNLMKDSDGSIDPVLQQAYDAGCKPWVLDPNNFVKLGRRHRWSPLVCKQMLRPIFRQIVLKHTLTTVITDLDGTKSRIGSQVPSCSIYSVELQYNEEQADAYRETHGQLSKSLYRGGGNGKDAVDGGDGGRVSMDVHRHLLHAVFDGHITTFLRRLQISTDEAREFRSEMMGFRDLGASYLFLTARPSSEFAV